MKLINRYKDTVEDLLTITHKDIITIGSRSLNRETYEPILQESQEFSNYQNANIYGNNLYVKSDYAGRIYYDFDTEIWIGGYTQYNSDEKTYSFFQYNRDKIPMTQHLTLKNGNTTGSHQYCPVIIQWDKFKTPVMMSQQIGSNTTYNPREMYYLLHDVDANTAHGIYMCARGYYNRHIPEMKFDTMYWDNYYDDNTSDWPRNTTNRNGVQLIHVDNDNGDLYWFSNNESSQAVCVVKRDKSGDRYYLNLKDNNAYKNLTEIQGGDSIIGLDHMYYYKSTFLSQWQEFDSSSLQGWKYHPSVKQNSDNTHSLPLIIKYNFDLRGQDNDGYPDYLEECVIDWGGYNPDDNMFESQAYIGVTEVVCDCWTFEKENGESILNFVYSWTNGFIYLLTFTISPEDSKILTYNQDMIFFKSHINYPRLHCITKDFKTLLLNRQLMHHEFLEWNDQQGWVYSDYVYSDTNIIYDHQKRRVITKTINSNAKSYNIYEFQKSKISLTGLKPEYTYKGDDITEDLKLNVYESNIRIETKVVLRVLTPNAKIMAPSITYTPYDNTTVSYTPDNVANASDLDRVIYDNTGTFNTNVTYDMFYNGDIPTDHISGDYVGYNDGTTYTVAADGFIDTAVTVSNVTEIEFKVDSLDKDGAFFGASDLNAPAKEFSFGKIGASQWAIGLGDISLNNGTAFALDENTANWTSPDFTIIKATWDGETLSIYQDDNLKGSETLTNAGGSVPDSLNVYIGNINKTDSDTSTWDMVNAVFSDVYVNKTVTNETDGVNDPMNIIFESTEPNTTWGEMRTTADTDNTLNTSKFKVYSSMDGIDWTFEYSNTHEQNGDKIHPLHFISKYAMIEVTENNADDGVGRILVKRDVDTPQPWWDITIPIFSPDPVETHIGEFTSSAVSDAIVPLIIKSNGSIEIETYAMSMAEHEAAFGIIPEPTA